MAHHLLYLALAISSAEAAIRSFREGNWRDAVHQAIAATIYACLAFVSSLQAMGVSDIPSP
jgi:hypothetical protein